MMSHVRARNKDNRVPTLVAININSLPARRRTPHLGPVRSHQGPIPLLISFPVVASMFLLKSALLGTKSEEFSSIVNGVVVGVGRGGTKDVDEARGSGGDAVEVSGGGFRRRAGAQGVIGYSFNDGEVF